MSGPNAGQVRAEQPCPLLRCPRGDDLKLKLSFLGGAGTVTGSRHLLTAGERRVLIDCGLFQGLKRLRLLNWQRPLVPPSSVDHVVLTHAHIDHIGYLPRFVREGFRGHVHCTRPTSLLAPVLLYDAAKLQEEDADYANRKGFSKHRPALPLFDSDDVRRALRLIRPVPNADPVQLGGGVSVRLHDAGHVLGSAFVEARLQKGGRETVVAFSGDLGQYHAPLHNDPAPLPPCDALVIESTYGDRLHDRSPLADRIRAPFRRALARGGTILIPSFALARVQTVTAVLRDLMDAGEIPRVPVHIDSPMAVEITRIYRRFAGTEYLEEALTIDEWRHLFPSEVHLHATVEESRRINELSGGRIIISSSGMLTGGRVLHHLRRLLPDARNLIVLVGYQAAGTRGRALLDGATALRMHGQEIPVRAEHMAFDGLSAHADAADLVRWMGSGRELPRKVFITHGEPAAAAALAERIRRELHLQAQIPEMGDEVDLSRV